MLLSKDNILNADDLPRELVTVAEWGGDVYVRVMSGSERDCYELRMGDLADEKKRGKVKDLRATLACLTICDDKGKRLFTEAEIEALGKKSASALDKVVDVATKLNYRTEKKV